MGDDVRPTRDEPVRTPGTIAPEPVVRSPEARYPRMEPNLVVMEPYVTLNVPDVYGGTVSADRHITTLEALCWYAVGGRTQLNPPPSVGTWIRESGHPG